LEFTDYLIWKFIAVVVLAFLYGLFGGVSRDEEAARREKDPE
jgi:uncharacterized membrane protein YeiH